MESKHKKLGPKKVCYPNNKPQSTKQKTRNNEESPTSLKHVPGMKWTCFADRTNPRKKHKQGFWKETFAKKQIGT